METADDGQLAHVAGVLITLGAIATVLLAAAHALRSVLIAVSCLAVSLIPLPAARTSVRAGLKGLTVAADVTITAILPEPPSPGCPHRFPGASSRCFRTQRTQNDCSAGPDPRMSHFGIHFAAERFAVCLEPLPVDPVSIRLGRASPGRCMLGWYITLSVLLGNVGEDAIGRFKKPHVHDARERGSGSWRCGVADGNRGGGGQRVRASHPFRDLHVFVHQCVEQPSRPWACGAKYGGFTGSHCSVGQESRLANAWESPPRA